MVPKRIPFNKRTAAALDKSPIPSNLKQIVCRLDACMHNPSGGSTANCSIAYLQIEARTDRVFVRLCQQAKVTGRAEDRAGGELGLGVWYPGH